MRTAPQELNLPSLPLLLFGGPYSNLAATRAMRTQASRLGITPDRVFCNGDLVAYCAEPEQTIEEIKSWGVSVVMGNCEESLASNAPGCGCGFAADSTCALLSEHWYAFSSRRVSDASRRWMQQLPRSIHLRFNGCSILLVHGSPTAINSFVFASTEASRKRREFAPTDVDVIIGGHSGIPFGQRIGSKYWLNTGVIGMPANDGTQDGWYLLLTAEGPALRASWRRLVYPWRESRTAMIAAGLDNGYAQALQTGLWPSMDILPPAEKAQRGKQLRPKDLIINRPPETACR